MYAIKDWNSVFEDAKSREVEELKFCKWPVTRTSESAGKLRRTVKGSFALGVFSTLVELAARMPTRGILCDSRGPMTPERYADRYGLPVKAAREAFEILSSPSIGWLVTIDAPSTDHRRTIDEASTDHRPSIDVPPHTQQHHTTPHKTTPSPSPEQIDQAPTQHRDKTGTGTGAAAADDGLRQWAAERARRPEWLPQGKGWIRAGVWLAAAQACPAITREQFDDIIREAKASRATLANPAGFVLSRLRELGGVA